LLKAFFVAAFILLFYPAKKCQDSRVAVSHMLLLLPIRASNLL